MMEEYLSLAEELKYAAKKIYDLRYQMSNGGNLSARIPGTNLMMVKGTDVAFDEVSVETLVITDFEGHVVEGSIKPSKEALLHGAIYQTLPDVRAIMHCHSPYATAWAAEHQSLEFTTHHSEMKLGSVIPVFDTHSYAVPKERFPEIMEHFITNKDSRGFLLRGHGQVTVAKDIRSACHLAELMEETAQIAVLIAAAR